MMIQVSYTENNNCYLFTNFANSNNPIFTNPEEVNNFKERCEAHLSSLVEILAYSFHADHYQLIIVLKERKTFEEFYRKKKKNPELEDLEIPESTYILSQEMANLQSGYAKMFNHKYKRFGSLFGRRYTKVLLENANEVEKKVQELNEGRIIWDFERLWSYIYNFIKRDLGMETIVITTKEIYDGGCSAVGAMFRGFLDYRKWHLRGSYVPVRMKC